MPDIVMGPDGKPVFLGREAPDNIPVVPKNPFVRHCPKCGKESDNSQEICSCGNTFGDSKMQCPVCKRWFDYLVGENTPDGGRMGCEACWKPGKVKRVEEKTDKVVFD